MLSKFLQPGVTFAPSDGSDSFSPNMSTDSLPPAVICAENIALLYLLHPVPAPPSSNAANAVPIHQGIHSLSFTQELNLAKTLAFLSYTKDDVNHIPAICIEENPKLASLNVMVAVNRARWAGGSKVLQNLEHSFDVIFAILSKISEERDRSRVIEHQIFTAIISMCSHRILSRLRFVAKNSKPSFRAVIGEAITSLKQIDQQILQRLPVDLFKERAKVVVKLADSWAKHQKSSELENLVEGIYQLKQVPDLQVLLESIPNFAMDPSSRRNLFNIISKVSRYREAARFLYRAAKKIPFLQRAKVVPVNLPKQAFNRVSSKYNSSQLVPRIAEMSRVCRGPNVDYLCRLLNMNGSQLNEQLAAQTEKTLQEAKIHAEIQLVYYYELNPSRLRPRVVCSSKDACFLCSTFILTQGKMYTPRCHGRLYPGWRLPLLSNLENLHLRLNTALEDQIKDSLKALRSRKKKTVHPDPNESTLLTLPLSTSTLYTTSAFAGVTERKETPTRQASISETVRLREYSRSPKDRALVPFQEQISGELDLGAVSDVDTKQCDTESDMVGVPSELSPCGNSTEEEEEELPERDFSSRPLAQLSSQSSNGTTPHKITTSDIAELVQGVSQVSSVGVARNPQFHTTGELEIHIEYTAESVPTEAEKKDVGIVYSIEWLSDEEARELAQFNIVDVEAMQYHTSHELDSHDGVIISARGAVVRIKPQQ